MVQLCSHPPSHPLHSVVHAAAKSHMTHHHSPIHNLLFTSLLQPNNVEVISTVWRSPSYNPAFSLIIKHSKEESLEFANLHFSELQDKVYCDSSGFQGGIGTSAVLYEGNQVKQILRYYPGTKSNHTVYEVEGISLVMHLLADLNRQLQWMVLIKADSHPLL
jgi:hypothetical protein